MTHFEEIKKSRTPKEAGRYLCEQFGECNSLELDEDREPLPFTVCPVIKFCHINSSSINGWERWLNMEEKENEYE